MWYLVKTAIQLHSHVQGDACAFSRTSSSTRRQNEYFTTTSEHCIALTWEALLRKISKITTNYGATSLYPLNTCWGRTKYFDGGDQRSTARILFADKQLSDSRIECKTSIRVKQVGFKCQWKRCRKHFQFLNWSKNDDKFEKQFSHATFSTG